MEIAPSTRSMSAPVTLLFIRFPCTKIGPNIAWDDAPAEYRVLFGYPLVRSNYATVPDKSNQVRNGASLFFGSVSMTASLFHGRRHGGTQGGPTDRRQLTGPPMP